MLQSVLQLRTFLLKNIYLALETRNPGSDYRQPSLGMNSESTYVRFGIAASTSAIESHLLSGITMCQHSMELRTSTD
jgi:hypothetical protein